MYSSETNLNRRERGRRVVGPNSRTYKTCISNTGPSHCLFEMQMAGRWKRDEGITFPYTHPPEAAINVRVERTFYFFYFRVISRAKTHNSVSVCVCSLLPYLPIRSGDCCHAGNSWTHERMTTRRYCAIVGRNKG